MGLFFEEVYVINNNMQIYLNNSEYKKWWYQQNRDRLLLEKKEYYQNNREEILIAKRRYCLEHIKEKKFYDQEYYIRNAEKKKLVTKLWIKANPEKHKENSRRSILIYDKTPKAFYKTIKINSKHRGMNVLITRDIFVQWYISQNKICYYCGITEDKLYLLPKRNNGSQVRRLTVDRLNNQKPYRLDNIVLACWLCNRVKNDYFTENEMFEIAEIIKRKRKEI